VAEQVRSSGALGGAHPRVDARGKVTGRARYAADLSLPGMLHARAVYARRAHADIEAIDSAAARDADGVVAVLTAEDVPGKKRFGLAVKHQPVLADDRVRFVGDAVALVVAKSPQAAEAGATGVRVRYRDLPVVSDPREALSASAPALHLRGNLAAHHQAHKGDPQAAVRAAAVVLEREYVTQFVEHAYLEPEAVLAEPLPDGGVRVTGCVQNVFTTRRHLCRVLDLPMASVEVRQSAVGGSFGGKDQVMTAMSCRAALAALRTGKPVRMVNSREDSFLESYKRHPYALRYELGCDGSGVFAGMKADILADAGAYAALTPFVTWRSTAHATGPYRIPNLRVDVRAAYTNNGYTSAMRGFGTPQICFAVECLVDELAEMLGTDPLTLRLRNVLQTGDETGTGQVLNHAVSIGEVLTRVAEASGYVAGWHRCRDARGTGDLVRGFGLACSFRGVSFGPEGVDAAGTLVSIQSDGSIVMSSGICEMGQGSHTSMAIIVAEELGTAVDRIAFLPIDTAQVPDSGPTVASRGTFMGGNAARRAAHELKERILQAVADDRGITSSELDLADGRVLRPGGESVMSFAEAVALATRRGVPLIAVGWYKVPDLAWDRRRFRGQAYATYVYGANVAEVEVDRRTGRVRVRRFFSCHDVGRAVSKGGVRGQVNGGVAMGLGYALWENFLYHDGVPLQQNLDGYAVPTALDVPEADVIVVENPDPFGPFGAKSVGEPVMEVAAPAVANAIANATGRRLYELPLTMEQVLLGKPLVPG
jgi:CO/xanthine dehydrogenase Mo-binding subunit